MFIVAIVFLALYWFVRRYYVWILLRFGLFTVKCVLDVKRFVLSFRQPERVQYIGRQSPGNIHLYKVRHEDKDYGIHVVAEDRMESDVVYSNVVRNLPKRTAFVYCCLSSPTDENIVVELTSLIREFVFHFDKRDANSRLAHFIKYVQRKYNLLAVEDMEFVMYMNDNTFTERHYKVQDIFREDLVYGDILDVIT
jgi:hypothetical protein